MAIRNELTASAVLLLVVARADARSPETDLAAPGAPLYEYAVQESIRTLSKQKSGKGAENIPFSW